MLSTLLPFALLGALVLAVSVGATQQIMLNTVLQRNTAQAQVAAAAVAANLTSYLRPLQIAADTLAGFDGNVRRQQFALGDMRAFLSPFEGGVTLLDVTGTAVASTPGHPERLGLNYSFRQYFQTARETLQPVFSAVLQERPSGQDAVVIAVPVLREQHFAGVLLGVLFIKPNLWQDDLAPLRAQPARHIYITDGAGQLIYQAGPISLLSNPGDAETLRQSIVGRRPNSKSFYSYSLGRRMVVSSAPLPGINWSILLVEPWNEIIAPTIPYLGALVGLMVLGIMLALELLLIHLRRVTRPLVVLVREAEQVTDRAPFHPLAEQGPREVRTLIRAFNRMVNRLAQQQDAVRQYANQVLRSQEDERQRLSRDLHDGTVQELVGLLQRIELCRGDLARDPGAAQRRLDELQDLAQRALADARRMSNDLRPLLLEHLGLPAAIRALCDEVSRQMPNARVHCEIVGNQSRLPADLELTAFRIAQEALTNLRKHAASATQVNVALYFEEWGIAVSVEDNGPGFAPVDVQALARSSHLGLAGMVERARLFDGEINIVSVPGEGTSVFLRLPYPDKTLPPLADEDDPE